MPSLSTAMVEGVKVVLSPPEEGLKMIDGSTGDEFPTCVIAFTVLPVFKDVSPAEEKNRTESAEELLAEVGTKIASWGKLLSTLPVDGYLMPLMGIGAFGLGHEESELLTCKLFSSLENGQPIALLTAK